MKKKACSPDRNPLHLDMAALDGLLGVVAGRVEHGKKADHHPLGLAILAIAIGIAESKRTEAAVGKLNHFVVNLIVELSKVVCPLKHNLQEAYAFSRAM